MDSMIILDSPVEYGCNHTYLENVNCDKKKVSFFTHALQLSTSTAVSHN